MGITDILHQTGGLQSMARELGISENEVQSGAEALGPQVLSGFQQHTQHPEGMNRMGGLLSQLGGGGLLDNVVSQQPTDLGAGNSLLSHLFGSKDVSRNIAQTASQQSGVNPSILKRMLPMLAMLVAGHMARQGGGLGSALGGLTGGLGGGLGGIAGSMLGGKR